MKEKMVHLFVRLNLNLSKLHPLSKIRHPSLKPPLRRTNPPDRIRLSRHRIPRSEPHKRIDNLLHIRTRDIAQGRRELRGGRLGSVG